MRIINTLIEKALEAKRESGSIEFKAQFDIDSKEQWCEIVKDLVAMSNSSGGAILFGVTNNGACSGFDCTKILALDPADITNKIASYTGIQFSGFHIHELEKSGKEIAAIEVRRSRVPMVFAKEGTYSIGAIKKTAFARGTLYFRHGAKSEPADSHDLKTVIERERKSTQDTLLERFAKIAKIPANRTITVESTGPNDSDKLEVVISNNPNAMKVGILDINKTYPYRQMDITRLVNEKLNGNYVINTYDVKCIRHVYKIDENPEYSYRALHTSQHYSPRFVQFILDKYNKDHQFFKKTREEYHH